MNALCKNFRTTFVIASFILMSFLFSQSVDEMMAEMESGASEASAASTSGKTTTSLAGGNDSGLEFTADSSLEIFVPVTKKGQSVDTYMKAPALSSIFGITQEKENLKIVSLWDLKYKMRKNGVPNDLYELTPSENYISYREKKLDLSFGLKTYNWGSGDGENPTDTLNPKDYRSFFSPEKIPSLSGSAIYYPNNELAIELVYLPFKNKSVFPLEIEDELPDTLFSKLEVKQMTINVDEALLIKADPTAITTTVQYEEFTNDKIVSYDTTDYDLKKPVAAIRLRLFSGKGDFAISYAYDRDEFYTPKYQLEKYTVLSQEMIDSAITNLPTNGNLHNQLRAQFLPQSTYRIKSIELIRTPIHRIGFDLRTSAGPMGLWVESCYSITSDLKNNSDKLRNHNLRWTTGTDFNYGPKSKFYLNLQYYGKYIPKFDKDFNNDYTNGLPSASMAGDEEYMSQFFYRAMVNQLAYENEGLSHGILLKMDFPFAKEKWNLSIVGTCILPMMYNKSDRERLGSLYFKPELSYKPTGGVGYLLGANLINGWKKLTTDSSDYVQDYDDKMGKFHEESSIYFRVEWLLKQNFTF